MKLQCDPRPNRLDVTDALARLGRPYVGAANRQIVTPITDCQGAGVLVAVDESLDAPLNILSSFKRGSKPQGLVGYPVARRFSDRRQFESAAQNSQFWETTEPWTSEVTDKIEMQMWERICDKTVARKYENDKERESFRW